MNNKVQRHHAIAPLRPSLARSPLRRVLLLLLLGLSFVLLPAARAQLIPPPDGGYANENTAEGDNALFSLTSGTDNTAVGFRALESNTTGGFNTASGAYTLQLNTTGFF